MKTAIGSFDAGGGTTTGVTATTTGAGATAGATGIEGIILPWLAAAASALRSADPRRSIDGDGDRVIGDGAGPGAAWRGESLGIGICEGIVPDLISSDDSFVDKSIPSDLRDINEAARAA